MKKSTTSPSAAMHSTDDDCVASQRITIQKTPTCTYTIHCGRHRCPAVFVYDNSIDWPTVNCIVDAHYPVCTGQLHGLAPSHPPDIHGSQHAPSPPQLIPKSWGIDNKVIASSSKRRQKENERKEDLENDEYTEDVQPTSVWYRGCQKAISLDKRCRYYPGLWVKHRGKCPGILKMKKDKFALRRDWIYPESAAYSFEMSDEYLEGEDNEVTGFSSKSGVVDSKNYGSLRTLASNVRRLGEGSLKTIGVPVRHYEG